MNELGESSAHEHEALGHLCDPSLLAWVVTIGPEADKYLAPAAKARGCQVRSFMSAIDAGAFVRGVIEEGRSEEHTYELQSLMRISYAVFCLKKKKTQQN